ncbi:unnamed protein product [Peronospora destructor]|uniref:Uncharacterized protein n=1 Tax=Peronospora destructor TaxID=86335 RepID=A0AAV0V487_9STRA|nr:unnamed protein product [Peronospora destructor]
MWVSETGLNDDDDLREIQRRQKAYARELDKQIAMRRMHQQKEQMEREELERKLAPGERSPSKWLVEGGHLDVPEKSQSPWKMRQSEEQRQDRGAATCEASSISSSYPRFRVTDASETSQRLRERAQKMHWKRILDEQVKEKARLKHQEEMERRRSEEGAAREEACLPPRAAATSTATTGTHFASKDRQDGIRGAAESLSRPLVPSRLQVPQGDGQIHVNDGGRDTFDRSKDSEIATRHPYSQGNDAQATHQQMKQQSRMIEEYRSLLAEIRHERQELRRERDEVWREKEELRVQQVLLQLENEKMANLVDAQRALNEQHQLNLKTEQVKQAQHLAQQQQAMAHQHRQPPVQSVDFKLNTLRRGIERPRQLGDDSEIEAYSRLGQIRQTIADLNIHDEQPQPVSLRRRRKPPSPMSMADFSAPTPNKRLTTNIVNSPGFQQLSQYRSVPAIPAHDDDVLNQSLIGESVFVPLSPKSQNQCDSKLAPKTASSPDSGDRPHSFQSSRVIKSRGFYDFEQEFKSDKVDFFSSGSVSGSGIGKDLESSLYDDDDEYDASGIEDELDQLDASQK